MKSDVSVKRVAAFAKRLLQGAAGAPANYACGALFLMSEVLKAQPALWTSVMQPEDVADAGESFKDAAGDRWVLLMEAVLWWMFCVGVNDV